MDDILLADSDVDTLEKMKNERKFCNIGDYKLVLKI